MAIATQENPTRVPTRADRSRAEALLERKRAERAGAAQPQKRGATIELGEFSLMLFFAAFFDLVSLIPWLNLASAFLGNLTFSVWFRRKGVSFKKLRFAFASEILIEIIPFLSILPGFLGLIIAAYITQRTSRLIGQLPGGHLAAAALEGRKPS